MIKFNGDIMKINEDFLNQIYGVVEEIPFGKVITYGEIAKLAGYDKNSRLVGRALSMAGMYGNFPCHRVVNSAGRLVHGWHEQKELLLKEGITFKKNGNVDLIKHLWNGE